jgi:hypothetical protein
LLQVELRFNTLRRRLSCSDTIDLEVDKNLVRL